MVEFKKVKVKSPWINTELFEKMKHRDDAFETAHVTMKRKDFEAAHKLRNKASNLCKSAKDDYTRNNIENNKANPKKFWLNLQNLWGSSKNSNGNSTITLTDPDTSLPAPKDKTCEIFNEFFTTVAVKI